MITDLRAAELCAAIYAPSDGVFDHFDAGADDGVCWAVAREADTDVVVFRGSVALKDWLRDINAMTKPYSSRRMGPVHPGFFLGLDHVLTDIRGVLRVDSPVVITGHSLGAARATLFAALMLDQGHPPVARVTFGEPKSGFHQLADFLSPVPARSYRNGDDRHHDYVTNVPFTFPPEDYVHTVPLTHVCARPPDNDAWGLFSWHHMPLYLAAMTAASTSEKAT